VHCVSCGVTVAVLFWHVSAAVGNEGVSKGSKVCTHFLVCRLCSHSLCCVIVGCSTPFEGSTLQNIHGKTLKINCIQYPQNQHWQYCSACISPVSVWNATPSLSWTMHSPNTALSANPTSVVVAVAVAAVHGSPGVTWRYLQCEDSNSYACSQFYLF